MRKAQIIAAVMAFLALGCVAVQPPRLSIAPPQGAIRWEHRLESFCPAADRDKSQILAEQTALLNFLGSDGWELVAVLPEAENCQVFVFKRRLK